MGDSEFLTVIEYAILLQVHANTIRRSIKDGRISAFRVGQGKRSAYRIARSEINRMAFVDMEKVIHVLVDAKLEALRELKVKQVQNIGHNVLPEGS